ncbi:hypothetical protein TCAL_14561 [Tigriopus californicus]|uniref:Uncharacterized protein n=1 Tax=Tigriopus californicus TaxID=6832 RepID=A0A553PAY0_TIGCA|nr:hypothetical protein TCAL_14561 [Tigriopus californicus]
MPQSEDIRIPKGRSSSSSNSASSTPPPTISIDRSMDLSSSSLQDDLNRLEVIDDLNINRWLMRIMRLGGGAVNKCSTGSSGYGQHALSLGGLHNRNRRKSAVEVNLTGGGSYLRPPQMGTRNRRFSDSMHLMIGPNFLGNGSNSASHNSRRLSHVGKKGSTEQSNLVRMRHSALGSSAPSLSSSMSRRIQEEENEETEKQGNVGLSPNFHFHSKQVTDREVDRPCFEAHK